MSVSSLWFGSLLALLVACSAGESDPRQPHATLKGHTKWIGCVAFSADSKQVATASADGSVRLWRVDDGHPVAVLKGHADCVCAVAFSPTGVVAGGYDGTVRTWPAKGDSQLLERRRGAVMTVAVSPDGKTVAAGGLDGVITLLDLSSGKECGRLTGHKTWVNSLAFTADGTRLASGSSDGTARLWDVKASRLVKTFELPDPREIRAVAVSPNGKTLAAGVRYGRIQVWDVATGKEVANVDGHDGDAWSVGFTPDGKTLVSGGGDWGKPGSVRLWDTATWTARTTLPHPGEVLAVAVSPNGRWLAVGGADRSTHIWDLRLSMK